MRYTDVIMCTMGTRGDILPFLAVATELVRRGCSVTLMANENWRDLIEDAGIDFISISVEDITQSKRDDYNFFVEFTLPAFENAFQIVNHYVERGRRPILIYRSNFLGMECAAEKFDLRHVKIALHPSAIKSFERPPWPLTGLAQGGFKGVFKQILIPTLYFLAESTSNYFNHCNNFRGRHGLPKLKPGRSLAQTEDFTLVMAPKWFSLPQIDWPKNCHCVGFPFHDTKKPVPRDDDVENFINTEGAPIIFTPGTGVNDVDVFFKNAEEVCEMLDIPGLFLSPHIKLKGGTRRQLRKSYHDIGSILSRSRLIVHHGGIGTTAQALRAGIPQVLLPNRFDQPDNAIRIASMGLGAAILSRSYAPHIWADMIKKVFADDQIALNLAKASASIMGHQAACISADYIEMLLA